MGRWLAMCLCVMLWFVAVPVKAVVDSHKLIYSTATLSSSHIEVAAGTTVWLKLALDLKSGWHVYWLNPGESGLAPTLVVNQPKNIKIGEMRFHPPHRIFVAHLVNYGYEDKASFYVPIEIPEDFNLSIFEMEAKGDWLVCEVDCIPEQATFRLSLPIKDHATISKYHDDILSAVTQIDSIPTIQANLETGEMLKLKFTSPISKTVMDAYVFPKTENVIELSQAQKYNVEGEQLEFELSQISSLQGQKFEGLLALVSSDNQEYFFNLQTGKNQSSQTLTLWMAMLFAIIGGAILNLMPCVFPILSLKILSLLKQQDLLFSHRVKHALAYTFGILLCFLAIALVVVFLRSTGMAIGWGFQMQSPLFLLTMFYIIVMVSLVLAGLMPFRGYVPGVASSVQVKHPLMESFMTGLLITLVSTPCTAPFMAPAIGFAFTQSNVIIVSLIVAIGFGLALPFVLLALIPQFNKLLPRPGPWLETFKEFLAFPMLLTAVWLLWILQRHISHEALMLVLISTIGLCFLCWAIKIKIANRFLRYGIYGLALAPMVLSYYDGSVPKMTNLQTKSSPFNQSDIDTVMANGQSLFVNVTADWCINCKVNETLVLSRDNIQKFFKKNDIQYMKIDWTQKDPKISEYLSSFNRFGVPLYVYYPVNADPVVLPQVLTQDIVMKTIQPTLDKE